MGRLGREIESLLPCRSAVLHLCETTAASALTQVLDEAAELTAFGSTQLPATPALAQDPPAHQTASAVPVAEMALSAAGLASAYGRSLRYAEALATLRSIAPLDARSHHRLWLCC